jgi:hypothetical protein
MLSLVAALLVSQVNPVREGVAKPDLRPTVYVESAEHLVALTRDDPDVALLSERILERRDEAWRTVYASIAIGTGLVLLGFVNQDCTAPTAYSAEVCLPNYRIQALGLLITSGGSWLGIMQMPRPEEYLNAINAWNANHPDAPLAR